MNEPSLDLSHLIDLLHLCECIIYPEHYSEISFSWEKERFGRKCKNWTKLKKQPQKHLKKLYTLAHLFAFNNSALFSIDAGCPNEESAKDVIVEFCGFIEHCPDELTKLLYDSMIKKLSKVSLIPNRSLQKRFSFDIFAKESSPGIELKKAQISVGKVPLVKHMIMCRVPFGCGKEFRWCSARMALVIKEFFLQRDFLLSWPARRDLLFNNEVTMYPSDYTDNGPSRSRRFLTSPRSAASERSMDGCGDTSAVFNPRMMETVPEAITVFGHGYTHTSHMPDQQHKQHGAFFDKTEDHSVLTTVQIDFNHFNCDSSENQMTTTSTETQSHNTLTELGESLFGLKLDMEEYAGKIDEMLIKNKSNIYVSCDSRTGSGSGQDSGSGEVGVSSQTETTLGDLTAPADPNQY